MISHILLPNINFSKDFIFHEYSDYLKNWHNENQVEISQGRVSASGCLQGAWIELHLYKKLITPWLDIMDDSLISEGSPLAYSEEYSKKLNKFTAQYKQSTIHAIHTRWWIEGLENESIDHDKYCHLIYSKKQSDGLFYDKDISETILRHRMKSEVTMSMAMSAQIMLSANNLSDDASIEFATNIVDPIKCPTLGYLGMEYLRLIALNLVGHQNLFPVGIDDHISACAEDLEHGWCDFSIKSKVDAYMGTAKRTQRDKPINSPLSSSYVNFLLSQVSDESIRQIETRLLDYVSF